MSGAKRMIRKATAEGVLVGYARVSTGSQDFSTQVTRLKEAGCTKVYSEKQSGTKTDREQLALALEYVREGDTLVCTKADRIARSTKDFLDTYERLAKKGVTLKVIDQPEMSGDGPIGSLLRSVLAAISEFELSLIRDRMQTGREKAKAEGVQFGREPKLTAATVETIKTLKAEGLNLEQIAVRTGLSMSSVQRAMRK